MEEIRIPDGGGHAGSNVANEDAIKLNILKRLVIAMTSSGKVEKTLIDVSKWQGVIDWEAVKPSIDGAIIRCGYAEDMEKYDDPQWERNSSECERLGIPYGAYLYSYATTDALAESEAAHAIRLLQGKHLTYPIFFDSEEKGTQGEAARTAKIFVERLRAAGYEVGVYASASWWNNYLRGVEVDCKWVASWGKNSGKPEYNYKPADCDIWQYTSNGSVPTLGRVDMNLCYVDYQPKDEPIAEPEPEPVNPTKTVDEIAHEVLEGKWGNGSARKQALINAGYDYDAVQARVNELLNEQASVPEPEPEPEPEPDCCKAADYIIEYGTMGVEHENMQSDVSCTYEKYKSGKMKMDVSDYFNSDNGSLYNGSYYIEKSLAFPIAFKDVPYITYSVRAPQGWVELQICELTNEKVRFWAFSSGKTIPKFSVDFHLEGKIE